MTADLQTRVVERLNETGHDSEAWALVLLAALEGPEALTRLLDDGVEPPTPQRAGRDEQAAGEPPGVYVSSISVCGFRGIGPTATLPLRPGPGLTLVVGRNGCGKSSFAEALEFLLTGRNFRWHSRTKAWVDGWRNLHHDGPRSIRAELVVEGKGPLVVSRRWTGDELEDGETTVVASGEKARPFESLDWKGALETCRPFLSYNELGSLLEDGPSKLYDAVSSALGLDELVEVQRVLADAMKLRKQRVDDAKKGAQAIVRLIEQAPASGDERFEAAAAALKKRDWDLEALEKLVAGEPAPQESATAVLREIANLVPPDIDSAADVVRQLREAHAACSALEGSSAGRAQQRAQLLKTALQYHEAHGGADCPVCGTAGVLSADWFEATRQEIAALEQEAAEVRRAFAAREAALQSVRTLVPPEPPVLGRATEIGLTKLADARRAWAGLAEAREMTSPAAAADHLEAGVLELVEALKTLVDEARAELARREDLWRPVAVAIAGWLQAARQAKRARASVADLREADKWWKAFVDVERNARFEPIRARARETWEQLRLESNVSLDEVGLEGTGQKRKVALRVTVDGTPAEAVGVMSQGELHALALSLFLPRAMLPESPFRFIAIDDPVQSMDPARVDGLARVLADAARTRQVIVFTHDDRLPDAVRRLGLPATILRVSRRDRSVVDVHEAADPVLGYLDDARAVAKAGEVPVDVVRRVVPGFCRSAIEAACMEVVRRRRLKRGEPHDAVEQLLAANGKTHPLMALALFDDESKASDVYATLRNRFGPAAADVFRACKEGAHEACAGEVDDLIFRAESLAKSVRALA